MNKNVIKRTYELAKAAYAQYGIDTDAAIAQLNQIPISIHCWQGDDGKGFEVNEVAVSGGGILATGNHPGRAATADELRKDFEVALSLLPGKYKFNIHASYLETDGETVGRDKIEFKHYTNWVAWAKKLEIGIDFNPTLYAHPMANSGYTLSSLDENIRLYWVEHVKRSRAIAEQIGKELGQPCVNNIWIPDGEKDSPATRLQHRLALKASLDEIFSIKHDKKYLVDAVECKLFGIGSESFVSGSHEFYLAYAVKNNVLATFDTGHFHPTEQVADKLSSLIAMDAKILLHVSRGVRWDSDHVVLYNDEITAIAQEIKRCDAFNKIYIALDYFDASINRIDAWVIGARATRKALLSALLEPTQLLIDAELAGNRGRRLALAEELKALPMSAVFDMLCLESDVAVGSEWIDIADKYEQEVLLKRDLPEFAKQNYNDLSGLVKISQASGTRSDYVQSGGGNTSAKLAKNLMAIKASGYRISQISLTDGFVVGNYAKVKNIFSKSDRGAESEKLTSDAVKATILDIAGYKKLRPSVETGFHAILKKYVIHTHPVYANLLTCSPDGKALAEKVLKNTPVKYLWMDYINPGADLTFQISDSLKAFQEQNGTSPDAIFLKNHGLIATSDSADKCIALHKLVNDAVIDYFKLPAYPLSDKPIKKHENHFKSVNAFLLDASKTWLNADALEEYMLYPDQLVFLNGNVGGENPKLVIKKDKITYHCSLNEASAIEDGLLAFAYIVGMGKEKGIKIESMPNWGIAFINGWEAEKYRKGAIK